MPFDDIDLTTITEEGVAIALKKEITAQMQALLDLYTNQINFEKTTHKTIVDQAMQMLTSLLTLNILWAARELNVPIKVALEISIQMISSNLEFCLQEVKNIQQTKTNNLYH